MQIKDNYYARIAGNTINLLALNLNKLGNDVNTVIQQDAPYYNPKLQKQVMAEQVEIIKELLDTLNSHVSLLLDEEEFDENVEQVEFDLRQTIDELKKVKTDKDRLDDFLDKIGGLGEHAPKRNN